MAKGQMVINYVPGEECRVAVVFDGKLNELHAERMDNVSHVGNIYVGKVVNVEAATCTRSISLTPARRRPSASARRRRAAIGRPSRSASAAARRSRCRC
jgi:hypothetical protein